MQLKYRKIQKVRRFPAVVVQKRALIGVGANFEIAIPR